jgi:hypothetical protein
LGTKGNHARQEGERRKKELGGQIHRLHLFRIGM